MRPRGSRSHERRDSFCGALLALVFTASCREGWQDRPLLHACVCVAHVCCCWSVRYSAVRNPPAASPHAPQTHSECPAPQ